MQQGEVYFLKLNNGEDIICQLIGDEENHLYITQPYRVELIQSPTTMTIVTTIMRWLPFDSLMEEYLYLDKKNILTYMIVDDIVASKYIATISDESRKEREQAMERLKQAAQVIQRVVANTYGLLH